jgi:hypothetical protein
MDTGEGLKHLNIPPGLDHNLRAIGMQLFQDHRWARCVGKACPRMGLGKEMLQTLAQKHAYQIPDSCTGTGGAEVLSLPATAFHLRLILRKRWTLLLMLHDPWGGSLLSRRDQHHRTLCMLLGLPIAHDTRMDRAPPGVPPVLDLGDPRELVRRP